MLRSRQAMFIGWGPDVTFLYNDAYLDILGARHPRALGRPMREVWPDAWPQVVDLVRRVYDGDALLHEDLLIPLVRHGAVEDCYFTFSYTPITDETGRTGGFLCIVAETTSAVERVRAEEEVRRANERLRAEGDRLRALFRQAPGFMYVWRGPDHVYEMANDAYFDLIGRRDIIGKPAREALPEIVGQGFFELADRVYATGEPFVGEGMPARIAGGPARRWRSASSPSFSSRSATTRVRSWACSSRAAT